MLAAMAAGAATAGAAEHRSITMVEKFCVRVGGFRASAEMGRTIGCDQLVCLPAIALTMGGEGFGEGGGGRGGGEGGGLGGGSGGGGGGRGEGGGNGGGSAAQRR